MEAKNFFTFEQLCIRKECGFSFDSDNIFSPCYSESFDDIIFKLICKINTSLMLLDSHENNVESFTLAAVPLSSTQKILQTSISKVKSYQGRRSSAIKPSKPSSLDCTALENAWEYLSSVGWHCFQSLALLQPQSIPDNGSRKYSLYQFTTCIMDVIRANYMFQKYTVNFHHETLEMFDETEIKEANQAVFALLWKRGPQLPKERKVAGVSLSRGNAIPLGRDLELQSTGKGQLLSGKTLSKVSAHKSVDPPEDMDVDEEISFKPSVAEKEKINSSVKEKEAPSVTPSITTRKRTKQSAEVDSISPSLDNSTLDTTISVPKKGRKSIGVVEWPEDVRLSILQLFDDFNPNVSEQKKVALTCKYVSLQLGKDLPSKILYQWVQKKGREVKRTITAFSIPEKKHKEVALNFFRKLNPSSSETARVAFTLKYLDAQYGLNINSKQLFTWLNEKMT